MLLSCAMSSVLAQVPFCLSSQLADRMWQCMPPTLCLICPNSLQAVQLFSCGHAGPLWRPARRALPVTAAPWQRSQAPAAGGARRIAWHSAVERGWGSRPWGRLVLELWRWSTGGAGASNMSRFCSCMSHFDLLSHLMVHLEVLAATEMCTSCQHHLPLLQSAVTRCPL